MTETRTEWGVRRTWGDVGSVAGPMWRQEAEYAAAQWPGELVIREVEYGEWHTPAPTTTEVAAAGRESDG